MKFTQLFSSALTIAIAATFSACSNTTTYDEALEKNRENIEDPQRLGDAVFLVEMKSLNMFQLQLLQIADQSGYSSELVNLGKEDINSFKTIAEDLTAVARSEEVRLPTEMSNDHEARLAVIRETPRQEIDRAVITELRETNEGALKQLTTIATEGSDPDVRAFAARKIGALRTHLQRVIDVEKGLLTTVKDQ